MTDTDGAIVGRLDDGGLMARYETNDRVVDVQFDRLVVTDVTLRLYRDEREVGSVYNDHGTAQTMFRAGGQEGSDFVGVELPKSFVDRVLTEAEELGITESESGTSPDLYRRRVLD